MLASSTFRALVNGQSCGLLARIARIALGVVEVPYRWAVAYRNHGFDTGRRVVHKVDVPVISVGNLTLGGTGKTPTVEWLARQLLQNQIRIAIVSRGYGKSSQAQNDEAMELAERLPQVPHVQDPDRVAAAERAIERYACQLILLDDGFQHRRLTRDLDIVLLDALEPFGFEHVFPRGTLREPVSGIARADVVALTRCDMISNPQRGQLRQQVKSLAPNAVWLEIAHRFDALLDTAGDRHSLATLEGQRIAAFCGIGNPANFRHTLSNCGWDLVGWREFPDHHRYHWRDANNLLDWSHAHQAKAVVCTHKDLVKLRPLWTAGIKLYAPTLATEIVTGQEELTRLLGPLIQRATVTIPG